MLNNNIKSKLYSYFINVFHVREYRRGWLKGACPNSGCGRIDKFGINLGLNRTNCFVCGYHPSPIRLVMDKEGLTEFQEAYKFLRLYEGKRYLEPVIKKIERVNTVLPDGYKNLLIGDNKLAEWARNYVKGRGFEVEEMAYKGWGYCNKDPYFGYIIIPFYMGGKLIYYNCRKFMGGGPKYQNPKIEDFGIGKSLILYNSDALALYNTVYLLEGVMNAETLGEQGIATGGKKVSDYQISMVVKSEVENIIILLDPDAISDSIKVGLKLVYHKKVKLIILPEENDVNDIGKEETLKLIDQANWLNYNDLVKMNNDLKDEKRPKYSYH